MASRTTVRLTDRELFIRAMNARGLSVRGLAERTPVSKSMIQHLRDGTHRTCSKRVADCIEDVLGVKGLLFVPVVPTTSEQPTSVRGRAA